MSDDKKPRRSSSNPRWAAIQELFQAFYAVRDLDADDPARKDARDRLFVALHKEVPSLATVIARKRARRGVGSASPTEIGEDMAAKFWTKRGPTKLAGQGDVAGQYDANQASFYTWLSRVLTNEYKDWVEANEVRAGEKEFPVSDPEPVEGHAAAWARQLSLENQVDGRKVLQAVANLEPELKAVVALRVFEELTVEKTAARLGLKVSMVRRRYDEAIDLLVGRLGGSQARQNQTRDSGNDLA